MLMFCACRPHGGGRHNGPPERAPETVPRREGAEGDAGLFFLFFDATKSGRPLRPGLQGGPVYHIVDATEML